MTRRLVPFASVLSVLCMATVARAQVHADTTMSDDVSIQQERARQQQAQAAQERRERLEAEAQWAQDRQDEVREYAAGVFQSATKTFRIYQAIVSAAIFYPTLTPLNTGTVNYGATYSAAHVRWDGSDVLAIGARGGKSAIANLTNYGGDSIEGRSGWIADVPGGVLDEIVGVVHSGLNPQATTRECQTVVRYRYTSSRGTVVFQAKDGEQVCTHYLPGSHQDGGGDCGGIQKRACSDPKVFWSTEGHVELDVSAKDHAVLRFPDGTTEELAGGRAVHGESVFPGQFKTTRVIDRNGNVTTLAVTPVDGNAASERVIATDALGRTTEYVTSLQSLPGFTFQKRLERVTERGIGGIPRETRYRYRALRYTPEAVLGPDLGHCTQRVDFGGELADVCEDVAFDVLDRIDLPDGRAYVFEYTPWGALSRVTTPDGGGTEFTYGDKDTKTFPPPQSGQVQAHVEALLKRRLTGVIDYPDGFASARRDPTKIELERVENVTDTYAIGRCRQIVWTKSTDSARKITRRGTCYSAEAYIDSYAGDDGRYHYWRVATRPVAPSGPTTPDATHGRTIAEETYDVVGGREVLVQAVYYGNTGRNADTETETGTMYMAWETASFAPHVFFDRTEQSVVQGGAALDVRTTKIVRFQDGIFTTETLTYERGTQRADAVAWGYRAGAPGGARTTGQVVAATLIGPEGVLRETRTEVLHAPAYDARNLIGLPAVVETRDGAGAVLSRVELRYDEGEVARSGTPGLEPVGAARGNPTSVVTFVEPALRQGAITKRTGYQDDGAVAWVEDGRGGRTETSRYPRPCTEQPIVATSVKRPTPDAVDNTASHVITTYTDCWTGATLAVRDLGGNLTCTQYDEHGRVVETAVPGDQLSNIPGRVRFPECDAASGRLRSASADPTTWIEYEDLDRPGRHRTITHTKNGGDGVVQKTFYDGRGRAVQQCAEIDPTSLADDATECAGGGCTEICSVSTDDASHARTDESVPFASRPRDALGPVPADVKIKRTERDALGRPVYTELLGSGLPATTTIYGAVGGRHVATSTTVAADRTKVSKSYADLLGHVVEVSVLAPDVPACGGACTTTMRVDALGRVLSVTGPGGANETATFEYDGLGRRTKMNDPDLGTWTMTYDANGNLESRTDAKGQTIRFAYDALDRLTTKTLPFGPEDERIVTYCYDGTQPDASGTHCSGSGR